ncbi:MAG: bifunctional phosphoserine phosphatase/homoserine phosphotransferase ThrH [Gammaproteobacteria bacterium]|nr:bifunctional phosphoserine phosphatase/homoserine phosphotransferase ThrH [Gammaproteobacteria bacterium]|tara:strand:+ start:2129 stop:2740 length:612 start_codon:yes stop_codon:yes gene_type:complete
MEYICLDLEGVLVPEIWSEVAKFTGEDQFNLTTQDIKDYSELMDMRMDLVYKLDLSMKDIRKLVSKMEPFEGAKSFIDWARDNFQVTIVSDSFYQLAWPLIRKLETPSIICHHLEIEGDRLKGYKLRQSDNKKKVVQSLKSLKYRVFAAGDSYNDIQMLSEADLGIFFRAPKHIREEYSDIKGVDSHQELKNIFSSASSFIKN